MHPRFDYACLPFLRILITEVAVYGERLQGATSLIPLDYENDWRQTLSDLPPWRSPLGHALVVAPHPDDEALGAGGLISHLCFLGGEVTVVAVTDGEKAYPDTPDPGDLRRREQSKVLARLGLKEDHVCCHREIRQSEYRAI